MSWGKRPNDGSRVSVTAEPSVMTAMLFRLTVSRRASSLFLAIARQTLDTWCIDHRQIVTIADRMLGIHLDLATEVHQEGSVADLADCHTRHPTHHLNQPVGVLGIPGRTGDVDPQPLMTRRRDVQGGSPPPACPRPS